MTSDATDTTADAAARSAQAQSKFMADLTKAMQVAAEEARARTLTQFQAEPRPTSSRSTPGRRPRPRTSASNADDDVAAVRDWSKAEIARIREETEAQDHRPQGASSRPRSKATPR